MAKHTLQSKISRKEYITYLHGEIDNIEKRMPPIATEDEHLQLVMEELRHIQSAGLTAKLKGG